MPETSGGQEADRAGAFCPACRACWRTRLFDV